MTVIYDSEKRVYVLVLTEFEGAGLQHLLDDVKETGSYCDGTEKTFVERLVETLKKSRE